MSDAASELERLCAEKVGTTLPLLTLLVNALTLREITVHVERGGGLSEAEVNDCDPERIRTLLNACEECEILEWVFRGRE